MASLQTGSEHWNTEWDTFQQKNECEACRTERKRRHRVLNNTEQLNYMATQDTYMRLQEPKFAEAVYITSFNHSAALYGLQRARMFARAKGVQLIWIQAEDRPPAAYYGDMSRTELQELK